MAIVQISRITNRKGLTENLPQLAGAEFGWCIDSRRLFIGNGTLQQGAPVIGNTEILTEFSDITVLSTYTYADVVVGYAAQTGPTPSDPVVRSVQAKLDDFADVRDFGATGDGSTDDTDAINRALYQLYCRDANNSQTRRTLYFPAGTYRVSDTIVIPTYAKLVGEGANCSIIYLSPSDSSIPDYVARYGDSQQQTGVNIGSNGATPPEHIEISSLSFTSAIPTNIFEVADSANCWFDSVEFIGPLTTTDIVDPGFAPTIIGVSFSSATSNPVTEITFDKCTFSGTAYGINTSNTIKAVTVSNSKFTTLYQGIYLDGSTSNGFRALHNYFDDIFAEGIVYNDAPMNVSGYNAFYNVGNNINNSNPVTPIITFGNDNNVSVSDMFQRSEGDNVLVPRLQILGSTAVVGGTFIQLGRYTREVGLTFELANNATSIQPIFTVNATDVKAFTVDYTIVRASRVRHGTFTVVAYDTDDSTLTLSYTDDYTENGDVGVTLSAEESGTLITVNYMTTNTGNSGTLTYSISHLA